MELKFVVSDVSIAETVWRYFDFGQIRTGPQAEGYRMIRDYLVRAVTEKFYLGALEPADYCAAVGIPLTKFRSKVMAFIKATWRPIKELDDLCAYKYYFRSYDYQPSLDEALAILLTTALSDTLMMSPKLAEEEFVRAWLRGKMEPLQITSLRDFYAYAFLLDNFIDTLYGANTRFTPYMAEYTGAPGIGPKAMKNMLGHFFKGCWWYADGDGHEDLNVNWRKTSTLETLERLKEAMLRDYKRQQQKFEEI